MQRKKCFGAMLETTYQDGVAFTQTRAQCRDCQDFRDCLASGRAKDETKDQGKDQAQDPVRDHATDPAEHQPRHEAKELVIDYGRYDVREEVKEDRTEDRVENRTEAGAEDRTEAGADDRTNDDLIAKIIDHSEILSNEMGTCLLEFLNRMHSSPFGKALFKNLVLFYEVPQGVSSLTVTVPLSPSILESISRRNPDLELTFDPDRIAELETPTRNLTIRIILLQKRFPNNPKATIGLIAREVASMFSSNDYGTKQILEVLPDKEAKLFTKMDVKLRTNFLIMKWGYREEHEAYRHEAGGLH